MNIAREKQKAGDIEEVLTLVVAKLCPVIEESQESVNIGVQSINSCPFAHISFSRSHLSHPLEQIAHP